MLKNFLIMCSGAETSILDDPRCISERTRYAAIGATVLSTAVLASLSGGYAIYTAFRNVPIAIILGIVWALIIFNLDRYIVSTLRKQRVEPGAGYRERLLIRVREIARALPRFLLAVLIAVVVTRPLELKLFEREISATLENKKSDMLVKIGQDKRREFPQIDELATENQRLNQQIADKEKQRDELHELAMEEALGKPGARTTGRFGKGIVYEQRYLAYQKSETELAEFRKKNEAKITANDALITQAKGNLEQSIKAARVQVEAMDGLAARLKAFSDLRDQSGNEAIAAANWFILVLFLLLEAAPIIVKLLSDRGPYDEIYDTNEYEVYVSEKQRLFEIEEDANTKMTLTQRRNATILDQDSRLRKGLVASFESLAAEELRKARHDIAAMLVANWRDAELKNFNVRFESNIVNKNGNKDALVATSRD